MSVLRLQSVSKSFTGPDGTVDALRDVSLDVDAGSRIAVVGPNGAGKSTLLRVAAGILAPTRGTVRRTDRCVPLIELGMGFHRDLTGWENLEVGLALARVAPSLRRGRRDAIADYSGLGDHLSRQVKHYSDGMVARLSCAIAVHSDPELLLVDEVLAVGDAEFQRQMISSLDDLSAEGTALVLVTHSPELALSATDSAVWVESGTVRSQGTTQAILAEYEAEALHGYRWATDPAVRVEALGVEPTHLEPGAHLVVRCTLIARRAIRGHRARVEFRPVIGEAQPWMRPRDEPLAHRHLNLVGATADLVIPDLDPGRHTIEIAVPVVPIAPTLLDLTLVLTDGSGSIEAMSGVDLPVGSRPMRPTYLLNASVRGGAADRHGSPGGH